jgi:hypothetical protein
MNLAYSIDEVSVFSHSFGLGEDFHHCGETGYQYRFGQTFGRTLEEVHRK